MIRRTVVTSPIALATLVVLLSSGSPHAQSAPTVGFKLVYASHTDGRFIEGLARDGSGQIWALGLTSSPTMAMSPDALQRQFGGGQSDLFLEHLQPDGTVTYRTYLGGTGVESVAGLALDPQGYIYVAGNTSSVDFQTTPASLRPSCSSSIDGFVMKLAPDGRSVIYSTCLGGSALDQLRGIAVDRFGRAHVVGTTDSADYPLSSNAARTTHQGPEATYSRISADGTALDYSTLLGGSAPEEAEAVAVDADGNAYVTGWTSSPDFTLARPLQPASRTTNSTAFVAKFTDAGLDFSTYLGGSTLDQGLAIGVTRNAIYVGGITSSTDFPGASRPAGKDSAGFIAAIAPDGGLLIRTTLLDGTGSEYLHALAVDSSDVVFAGGTTHSTDFPFSSDAPQKVNHGNGDNFVAVVPMTGASAGTITWSSYLGGANEDDVDALISDGAGGFIIGGIAYGDYPNVNGSAPQTEGTATLAHFAAPAPENIVLYARDASRVVGNWQLVSDATAAGGMRIWNRDAGIAKIGTAATNPANYFELTFNAWAGVPYHLWIRMKADGNSYQNDSVHVQFNDAVAVGGSPHWIIGTTGSTVVSLEDCGGCGEQAWGWNDNGYNGAGESVMFYVTGQHTIRIQQREDGVSIDQIVLSSDTWASSAPGANQNDTTILPQTSGGGTSENQPPTVSLLRPADGTTSSDRSLVDVYATANDSDGTVARVDFYANSTLVWTAPTAPYQFAWSSLPVGTYTVTAVATDNDGAHTTSQPVSMTVAPSGAGGLPSSFADQDIGDVGAAGDATYANGTFTVRGSGADVWGTADAFNYVFKSLAKDGAVIARVGGVSGEANWVKAGVMMRSALSPDSLQAFMFVSHAKGVCFQRRVANGAESVSTCGSASVAPRWVKLVRAGNVISGYESADGTTWTLVGTDTFSFPFDSLNAGLAVSSHVRGTLATATFDNVYVMAAAGPNRAPTVSLSSPPNGSTFAAPASIPIGLDAVDSDGEIRQIAIYANSTLIGIVTGSDQETHYDFTWSNVPAGHYSLEAVATDNAGATATSTPVSVTVEEVTSGNQCSAVTLSQTVFYSGGPASSWRINVTAPNSTCTWTASIDQPWLGLNGVAGPVTITGAGSGQVTLQTLDNRTGAYRYGTFAIAGTGYRVTQEPY